MNLLRQRLSGSSLGIQAARDVNIFGINISIHKDMDADEISSVAHNAVALCKSNNADIDLYQRKIDDLKSQYQQQIDDLRSQLWNLHAAWAEGQISQASVTEYIGISAAIAYELQILRKYHENRVICLDSMIINSFIVMAAHSAAQDYVAAYFVNQYLDYHQSAITSAAIEEITNNIEFINARMKMEGIPLSTSIKRRLKQISDSSLVELSKMSCAVGAVLDQTLLADVFKVLGTVRRRSSASSMRIDARQVAEVFSVNSRQPPRWTLCISGHV
jgi:hypothetical protein